MGNVSFAQYLLGIKSYKLLRLDHDDECALHEWIPSKLNGSALEPHYYTYYTPLEGWASFLSRSVYVSFGKILQKTSTRVHCEDDNWGV